MMNVSSFLLSEGFLVSVSAVLQFCVALMIFYRAMRAIDSHKLTWSILGIVFALMGCRRLVSLFIVFDFRVPHVYPEVIALIISILLFISARNIGHMIPALEDVVTKAVPDTSQKLREIAVDLTDEIQSDMEDLEEYKSNGESLRKSRETLHDASEKLVCIAKTLEMYTSGIESAKPYVPSTSEQT